MELLALKILIGFVVGTLIGLTGLGGGVLLLPVLIFGLKIPAIVAVGSDALFNFVTKIPSSAVHLYKGNVRRKVVLAMAVGSVPGSVGGVKLLQHLRVVYGTGVNDFIKIAIGILLIIVPVLLLLQRGYVDVGFMGGAQIDRFGNLNSSFIGDSANPKIRLPGTGGGNDISSLTNMIVAMKHEKRRFVANVDFITSPGWLRGGQSRVQSGLSHGGMWRVVTDLAIIGFDEVGREMKVLALHEGVSRDHVTDNTDFKILFDDHLEITPRPNPFELEVLRELDPQRLYTA